MIEWLEQNGLLLLLVVENAIQTIRNFRKTEEEKKLALAKKADKQTKALQKTVQKLDTEV